LNLFFIFSTLFELQGKNTPTLFGTPPGEILLHTFTPLPPLKQGRLSGHSPWEGEEFLEVI
jgi:hypothetical protein